MQQPISVEEMRQLERAAMASGTASGRELMERAGQGVIEAIFEAWPDVATGARRAVVLCGPGNNGGDGFVVARRLRAYGFCVEVFLYGDPKMLPPDARVNYALCLDQAPVHLLGFPVVDDAVVDDFKRHANHRIDIDQAHARPPQRPVLLIDALFGVGLSRPLSGLGGIPAHWDDVTRNRDPSAVRGVAIDVESGYHADTGAPLWSDPPDLNPFPVLLADLVVTFHRPKPVHLRRINDGVQVVVKDIGL